MRQAGQQITVCICTYKRPEVLRRCLEAVAQQETNGAFSYSITVVDNDSGESARRVVSDFTAMAPVPVRYCVENRRNIALARNRALENAQGNFIAFIDDDEFPAGDWLLTLFRVCSQAPIGGVLGPVQPHFEAPPPGWIIKGRFYERPRHPTGYAMDWRECRTGNVLFRRSILEGAGDPFRSEFGTGGEDVDFFRRMMERGHQFVWCDEALTWEVVPQDRWKRSFMLRRGLLRGRNTLRHSKGRLLGVVKSLLALPAYCLALPFLQVMGHHHFMKYLVKLCDHAGKLLALVGYEPIKEREM